MLSKPQNKIGCIDSDFTNEFVEFMEENKNKIIRYSEYINNKDLLKKYKLNELMILYYTHIQIFHNQKKRNNL